MRYSSNTQQDTAADLVSSPSPLSFALQTLYLGRFRPLVATINPPRSILQQMSTFSSQPIVIDGKGHLLGRLASVISKQVSDTLGLAAMGRPCWNSRLDNRSVLENVVGRRSGWTRQERVHVSARLACVRSSA